MIGYALRAFTIAMWVVVLIALGAAAHQIATAHADGGAASWLIGRARHAHHSAVVIPRPAGCYNDRGELVASAPCHYVRNPATGDVDVFVP